MGSYGQDDNLDEYDDDFIDDQDGDVRANKYKYDDEEFEDEEEAEEEVEEVEEEPVSKEALKLLKYRQQLKDELRSKLRQENGDGFSKTLDRGRKPPLNNFGSFFGPSQPVIAERVAQESKALLESRHLAPKASTSQSNGKKVNTPSVSGARNDVSRQPNSNATQVKSKAQLMKQTRDYSFLLSEDVDVPKPPRDPGQPKNLASKPDSRPTQVPPQRITSSGHSSRVVVNGNEQRKPRGTPQVCSTSTAPVRKVTSDGRTSNISSDSRRQQDLKKQPQIAKKMVAVAGNGSIRPPVAKILPPKKPVSSTDKKMIVERKTPPVAKKITSNGQRPPAEKSRAPGVIRSQERNVNVHQGQGRVVKRENASTQMRPPPKQSSVRGTLDRDRAGVQKPRGQLSVHSQSGGVRKDSNPRKRRAEEIDDDSDDYRAELRKLLGPRKRYVDDDDDDDMCMEVGFDTILKEESRSARIARQEDEEELAKIMEEERQEKLRREAKMRKKIQR